MKVPSWAIVLLAVALVVLPLVVARGAEFGGADAEAEEAIAEIQPDYVRWFSPLWLPPSGEVESTLFTLQAASGAALIAYIFGYRRGRQRARGE